MDQKKLISYIEALNGISYQEWIRLKEGVDGAFKRKKGEFEEKLKLANIGDVKSVIHSRFGCKLDGYASHCLYNSHEHN